MNINRINLVSYEQRDLDLWRIWERNIDFSQYQSHLLPENFGLNNDNKLYIICVDSLKIGAIWIEKIDTKGGLAWIGLFIGDSNYWNKGIGTRSILLIFNIAFEELKLNYIWLNVREKNIRAIECYKKLGFTIINQCGPRKFDDGSHQFWYEMRISKNDFISDKTKTSVASRS